MSDLGTILAEIYDQHGQLTPELVRDAARPDESPLHPYVYDKDPDDAAESYYLDRAHRLIQRFKVRIEVPGKEPRYVRAYLAVPGEEDAYSYVSHAVLLSQPSQARAAFTEAVRRVTQAQDAVSDLELILEAGGQPTAKPRRASKALASAASALA